MGWPGQACLHEVALGRLQRPGQGHISNPPTLKLYQWPRGGHQPPVIQLDQRPRVLHQTTIRCLKQRPGLGATNLKWRPVLHMFVLVPPHGHGLKHFPTHGGRSARLRGMRREVSGRLARELGIGLVAALVMVAERKRSLEVWKL